MQTTIDRSGRLVIPKSLREEIGLEAGDVEVVVDGAALRIAPITSDGVVERDGVVIIPAVGDGAMITDEDVQRLRDADRR